MKHAAEDKGRGSGQPNELITVSRERGTRLREFASERRLTMETDITPSVPPPRFGNEMTMGGYLK